MNINIHVCMYVFFSRVKNNIDRKAQITSLGENKKQKKNTIQYSRYSSPKNTIFSHEHSNIRYTRITSHPTVLARIIVYTFFITFDTKKYGCK